MESEGSALSWLSASGSLVTQNDVGYVQLSAESMTFLENRFIRSIVSGFSWFLMATGGFSFWVGGRALHEFLGVDRVIAELEGLTGAAVLIASGAALRAAAGLPLTRSRPTD